MSQNFRGIFTPLVTPLHDDERVDLDSLARLVEFQIKAGVHGLWAMGTTGEFVAFDEEERARAIACVVESAAGRVPVIANVSDASTRMTIRHARRAAAAGASAIAATPPYYFPHAQTELLAHYRSLRAVTDIPLYIYNIPQTVRVQVGLETAVALAEDGTVAGIKDSQNDLEWFRELTLRLRGMRFVAFAGTRHLIDAGVLAGAAGAIPSIANVRPELCVKTYEAAAEGDFAAAHSAQTEIVELESKLRAVKGSKNGATLAALKSELVEKGVIANAYLTSPLLG
jgi:4-hydroxy-tetrahydrodipicolinate synthase